MKAQPRLALGLQKKQNLKGLFSNFFVWLFLLALLACLPFISMEKLSGHLSITSHHSPAGDLLFPYITHLGDGLFAGLLILICLSFSYRSGLFLMLTLGLSSLIAQTLKHLVFDDYFRPAHYLSGTPGFHPVEGVILHLNNSFPSGHSTTAFAIFAALAFSTQRKWLQVTWFILAAIAGYSRVYLSQHFIMDAYAGMCIGTLTSLSLYFLFYVKSEWGLSNGFLKAVR